MNTCTRSALLCTLFAVLPTVASAVETSVPGTTAADADDGALRNGIRLQGPGLVVQGPVLQGPVLQGPVLQGPGLVLQGAVLQGPGVVLQGRVLQGPGIVLQGPVLQGPAQLGYGSELGANRADLAPSIGVLEGRPWPSVHTGPFAAITSTDVRVRLPQSR